MADLYVCSHGQSSPCSQCGGSAVKRESPIRTITNPVELLLSQLEEIRRGNAAMVDHISKSQATLRQGQKEEAKMERRLAALLAKHISAQKG